MYTLKIYWTRYETVDGIGGVADETTLFIPASEVRVHGHIDAGTREQKMKAWDEGEAGYFNYLSVVGVETTTKVDDHGGEVTSRVENEDGGRLIHVIRLDGKQEWYLASHAWLLGPNGDTIERVS
jgi:hypothetical protein